MIKFLRRARINNNNNNINNNTLLFQYTNKRYFIKMMSLSSRLFPFFFRKKKIFVVFSSFGDNIRCLLCAPNTRARMSKLGTALSPSPFHFRLRGTRGGGGGAQKRTRRSIGNRQRRRRNRRWLKIIDSSSSSSSSEKATTILSSFAVVASSKAIRNGAGCRVFATSDSFESGTALSKKDDPVVELDVVSKIYSLLSFSLFGLLAVDVGLNFMAFLLAWVSKHDTTFFTTNVTGFWTEKLCILGFVILLLMDFKAVALRQIARAKTVLKNIKYAKETTVQSIESTRNVEKFLTNVYAKSIMEILGGTVAFIGCLKTVSPSFVPRSALTSSPASVGPAIALFFGHAMFMLLNKNVVSQSADIVTPFPSKLRKTIATFDAALAILAATCAIFPKGWPGLASSLSFLLFSVFFTYIEEIKKRAKKTKKKKEGGSDPGRSARGLGPTS